LPTKFSFACAVLKFLACLQAAMTNGHPLKHVDWPASTAMGVAGLFALPSVIR
jgi:hypothetical protein